MNDASYKLLDFGDGRKLEKFGNIIVDRPAPAPSSAKAKTNSKIWSKTNLYYDREKKEWQGTSAIPNNWHIQIDKATLNLAAYANGQVGVFPEQQINWLWLKNFCKQNNENLKILNGFAYSGASSLFPLLGNSKINICHLDAAQSSITMAKNNFKSSNIAVNTARWIVDDILQFMRREIKRGNKYTAIIIDPPAFGRAKNGKLWKLKKNLPMLFDYISELFNLNPQFLLFTFHDASLNTQELQKQLSQYRWTNKGKFTTYPLNLISDYGEIFNAGHCLRWVKA